MPFDFRDFLAIWACLAVLSSLALFVLRISPISSKRPAGFLGALGSLPKKQAWIIMESPILAVTGFTYYNGSAPASLATHAVIAPFMFHYVHRALIYPHVFFLSSRFYQQSPQESGRVHV